MPVASTILMIRPAAFGFNEETAVNNFFQSNSTKYKEELLQKAQQEFDEMVHKLKQHDIDVIVFDDTKESPKPDAIFPNNWLSTFPDGVVSIFPMYAPNRRIERRLDIIKSLSREFKVKDLQDWSSFEMGGQFLEGTGSMAIDHENKIIYAAISERTNKRLLEKFAHANKYKTITFTANDKQNRVVYHTNVVMTLGDTFAVLCEDAIADKEEKDAVRSSLESTGRTIIPITQEQVYTFAGNMLQVKNKKGEDHLLLSQTAYNALSEEQKGALGKKAQLLSFTIATIEEIGGGSVRCMIAEIFLERK